MPTPLIAEVELQKQCRDIGVSFIATEIDVTLFARNMRATASLAGTNSKKHELETSL